MEVLPGKDEGPWRASTTVGVRKPCKMRPGKSEMEIYGGEIKTQFG
jgi:hypothetical protein